MNPCVSAPAASQGAHTTRRVSPLLTGQMAAMVNLDLAVHRCACAQVQVCMQLQMCMSLLRMQLLMHQGLQDAIPMGQHPAQILTNPRAEMLATTAMSQSWGLIAMLKLSRTPVPLHALSAAPHVLHMHKHSRGPAPRPRPPA